MSRAYATPLELELRYSQRRHVYLTALAVLVTLAILDLPMAWPLKVLLLMCLMSISYAMQVSHKHCRWAVWRSGTSWELELDTSHVNACLLPGCFLAPWPVILNFRLENGQAYRLAVWPDSVSSDSYRRLRVRLRLEAPGLFGVASREQA